MELANIGELVAQYEAALQTEYRCKEDFLAAHTHAEEFEAKELSQAYDDGVIDGKNAEQRKLQTVALLAQNEAVQLARAAKAEAERAASLAEIERKRMDAMISLVRAWLYSQSGGR